jgi:hypothetical protein
MGLKNDGKLTCETVELVKDYGFRAERKSYYGYNFDDETGTLAIACRGGFHDSIVLFIEKELYESGNIIHISGGHPVGDRKTEKYIFPRTFRYIPAKDDFVAVSDQILPFLRKSENFIIDDRDTMITIFRTKDDIKLPNTSDELIDQLDKISQFYEKIELANIINTTSCDIEISAENGKTEAFCVMADLVTRFPNFEIVSIKLYNSGTHDTYIVTMQHKSAYHADDISKRDY